MEQRQRLFIYDRKEMGVLVLLGLVVALFAFTLGVHLGKRIGPRGAISQLPIETIPIPTQADKTPNRQELTEQAKGVSLAVEESMNQVLHDEVARTGVKLDTLRQIELPDKAHNKTGGATTLTSTHNIHGENAKDPNKDGLAADNEPTVHSAIEPVTAGSHAMPPKKIESVEQAAKPESAGGKFTLQVGSYPTAEEAQPLIQSLEKLETKPYLKEVDLKEKGKWFRVFLGSYDSKEAAMEAGTRYQSAKTIASFIVSKHAEH